MEPSVGAGSALSQLVSVFTAGVGTSLTPCVYPLIPVTLALFGAAGETSRRRAFFLSSTYVLGIAATYTSLGMFSAKTGAVFGSILGNPWIVGGLTALLLALALYSLDVFQLRGVSTLQNFASTIGGKGYRGAFLMGTVSGLVAAPCAGPWLVVILGIAAASKSTAWGAALLFTYALGMGVLFIALGSFPSLVRRIPRSGNWLVGVKFIMAAAIIVVALSLALPLVRPSGFAPLEWGAAAAFALVGGAAGFAAIRFNRAALKVLAAFVLAFGVHDLVVGPQSGGAALVQKAEGRWLTSLNEAVAAAERGKQIAMVDLFAEWCAACKELDKLTFPDPSVKDALSGLITARVDFTTDTPETAAITEKYAVYGLPCILFLDGNGDEIPASRITGFLPPDEFTAHIRTVVGR